MKIIADLHIHSHYSRATSKDLNFEQLYKWAQLKGVQVVGSGDIAHPGWLEEMREKLEPAEAGLFRLKAEVAADVDPEIPPACRGEVRFMLAGEISNIYKKFDKVRKIHNVVFLPSLEAVETFQIELEKIGNIRSDGRPILGLDARDLFEIVLETDPQAYLIPAHIWTPWFSLFGSKSGFDRIEECFEDLTPHIFALETGLSSDPPMNWQLSALDRFTLVSNSDAHSPPKLAREANHFETELSYPAIFDALKNGDPDRFKGTIEFFPEEGKYHFDGHRKCGIRWAPQTTRDHDSRCPVCGRPVTVGVMHRVAELADRPEGVKPERWHPYVSLIPLPEVLAEVLGVGPASKGVRRLHANLLAKLGPELSILQDAPLEELERLGGARLKEAIRRMRRGEVHIDAGYDGEFGIIKLFEKSERDIFTPQLDLFGKTRPAGMDHPPPATETTAASPKKPAKANVGTAKRKQTQKPQNMPAGSPAVRPDQSSLTAEALLTGLNPEQQAAALCHEQNLLILAGPGTGKTRTLTHRIALLLADGKATADAILAITFTNKAAREMRERLAALTGEEIAAQMVIRTFHAFGALLLREEGGVIGMGPNFTILRERNRESFFQRCFPNLGERKSRRLLASISEAKNLLLPPGHPELNAQISAPENFPEVYHAYQAALTAREMLDYDDLLLLPATMLESHPEILQRIQARFRWISVDEYQDVNYAQYRLLRLLTPPEVNLCVIGDPDQAIYGFRGADRSYFLKFQEDYPAAREIRLRQNYRSSRPILSASRQVIDAGSGLPGQDIWTGIAGRYKVEIYQAPTDRAEAEYAVHQVERMVGGTSYFSHDSGRVDPDEATPPQRGFGDVAVLYRLSAQNALLSEAFQRSGIPYQSVGQLPIFEQKPVRELLAYLQLLHNPTALFHLETILGEALPQVQERIDRQGGLFQAQDGVGFREAVQHCRAHQLFSAGQEKRLSTIVPALQQYQAARMELPLAELISKIHSFILLDQSRAVDGDELYLIRRLVQHARPFEKRLGDFLEDIALQTAIDQYDPRADRVTLMTLHASKGLEFPVVFIVGCEEGLIPFRRPGMKIDEAEERRLFYVGMTRAQEHLILTHAQSRTMAGKKHSPTPSRYLGNIETALKELKKAPPHKPAKPKDDSQLKLF